MTDSDPKQGRARKCPICGAPPEARFRPFCSKRCADIDLGRWFSGSYSVPAVEPPEDEEWPVPEAGESEPN
jgi:endogenous inhibitor of DNA gyrase (YacG/DUF329 family)